VQAPTTLLAQVDSSVGGKTGVNHKLGKNLIGAFYSPDLVVADIATLNSLPNREWRSGLAEVIKYGLIADRNLFDQIETLLPDLNPHHPELESIISRCVEIKADVVAADERESGLRKILNFGHTLGHALESYTNYEYFRHGEAVLWGMLGEAFLSHHFGQLREMEVMRIRHLISRLEIPPLPPLDTDTFLDHARRDKKNRDGKIHILWLKHIGECESGPIESDKLLQVLSFWQAVSAKAAS
jgi:3-dehydroquinate synthase